MVAIAKNSAACFGSRRSPVSPRQRVLLATALDCGFIAEPSPNRRAVIVWRDNGAAILRRTVKGIRAL